MQRGSSIFRELLAHYFNTEGIQTPPCWWHVLTQKYIGENVVIKEDVVVNVFVIQRDNMDGGVYLNVV